MKAQVNAYANPGLSKMFCFVVNEAWDHTVLQTKFFNHITLQETSSQETPPPFQHLYKARCGSDELEAVNPQLLRVQCWWTAEVTAWQSFLRAHWIRQQSTGKWNVWMLTLSDQALLRLLYWQMTKRAEHLTPNTVSHLLLQYSHLSLRQVKDWCSCTTPWDPPSYYGNQDMQTLTRNYCLVSPICTDLLITLSTSFSECCCCHQD